MLIHQGINGSQKHTAFEEVEEDIVLPTFEEVVMQTFAAKEEMVMEPFLVEGEEIMEQGY
jgi:hypothetical protein